MIHLGKQAKEDYYSALLTETKAAEDYSDILQHLSMGISEEINAKLTKEIGED